MKRSLFVWVSAMMVVGLVVVSAQAATDQTGNGCPSGAHYNLNLIGMEKAKNIDPGSDTGSGHRIFVRLGSKDNAATTKILLEQGPDFEVLDYDGTDGQARFQLPNPDPDNDGVTQYSVYLRVLGKPSGKIRIATSAMDPELGEVVSDLSMVSVREKGQMKFANVSASLLYIYAWVYVDVPGSISGCPCSPICCRITCGLTATRVSASARFASMKARQPKSPTRSRSRIWRASSPTRVRPGRR